MNEKKIVVAVSGYFDPLHIGHIEYFKKAKELGDFLVVILNNEEQTMLKRGEKPFMSIDERHAIIKSIEGVDGVLISEDKDSTVCQTLRTLEPDIFANGGDRHNEEIPEAEVCKELDIKIVDGLGKKIQSSSSLLRQNRC